ncbi:Aste57867_7785 [Aphanomyces stellatus]|uniref:Aste57867_7785 protein n=1 Tax=Aphanomyces stellatus TaxID=120398 RepID=A0A485KIT5_9STRA|nr:hypothetical protein As57867_007755 [Aphanomyces stellatus]VFT84684.1 Aste57867_7785 [Aphanomyces stellatus]
MVDLFNAAKEGNLLEAQRLINKKKQQNENAKAYINSPMTGGNSALHIAASFGHSNVVEILAREGADIDAVNENGKTPLFVAAEAGRREVVDHLVKNKADVAISMKDGTTPLHIASYYGHLDVVELLGCADIDAVSENGVTPLFVAAQQNKVDIVDYMIKNHADINKPIEALLNNDGTTPLHIAASFGHSEVVKLLVREGANIDAAKKDGKTPLFLAAEAGKIGVANHLIKNNAVLDKPMKASRTIQQKHILTQWTQNGATPLWVASYNGHLKVVELLVHGGANTNATNKNGKTPLFVAAQQGKIDIVNLLIKINSDINKSMMDGTTPMHIASYFGHTKVVELLVHEGAIIDAADKNGKTPIFVASEAGKVDVVHLLIESKAAIDKSMTNGVTPLIAASYIGHLEVVGLLVHRGADMNAANKDGKTPLFVAAEGGQIDVVNHLNGATPLWVASYNGYLEVVELLVREGAYIDAANENGKTPLFVAAQQGKFDVVKLLITTKANINKSMKDGTTPLHIASYFGHTEIAELLIHEGACIQATNKSGATPLYIAAQNNKFDVVNLLIKNNADLDKPTKNGETPLWIASFFGHFEVVELLVREGARIDAANKNGKTPIYVAAEFGKVDVVNQLIKLKGDINKHTKNGATPLGIAINNNHADIVENLLLHGADIDAAYKEGQFALSCACSQGQVGVIRTLVTRKDISLVDVQKAVQISIELERYEALAIVLSIKGSELHRTTNNEGKLLLESCLQFVDHEAAMKFLELDLPVEIQNSNIVPRQNHSYSWAIFMDASQPVPASVRQSCLASILERPTFESFYDEFLHELAFSKDQHGREVIHYTDASTRKCFYNRLYFCGRYEIFRGPPLHVSNTSVVVTAYDHGICSQVFQEYSNANGGLDEAGFVACIRSFGLMDLKTNGNKAGANMTLSEQEFLRFCGQKFGGKVKVAMKFMMNSSEYTREVNARKKLDPKYVLQILPTIDQNVFQQQLPSLKINGDLSMAAFQQVLVMPAADRSLDDIYLKERPDDNKTKSLLNEVLLGLKHLHENGLVHGDLKKLNVLRIQNQLKLIDFDAAVRVGEPLGGKCSSGILPPEMFYNLVCVDDTSKYESYWERQRHEPSKRKKSPDHDTYVVKAYRPDRDVCDLPYSLVKATAAVDMWSFGCMVFQMLCGQELVPTDINQNVVLDHMCKAATWTEEKLTNRIDIFIPDEAAQDLIMHLLVLDPAKRLSATEALNHPFFTGIKDSSGLIGRFEQLEQNQAGIDSKLLQLSLTEVSRRQLQEKTDIDTKMATMDLGNNATSAMLDIGDVNVPTSFLVLPCKSLVEHVDATKVISFLKQLWDTGKKLQVVKGSSVGTIMSDLNAGDPLYLYLMDEGTGKIVGLDTIDCTYPIEIPTPGNNSFLLMNLPIIQSTFKSLKTATTSINCLQRAHVLPTSHESMGEKSKEATIVYWSKEIENAIAELSEPTVSFQVLQQALDVEGPVAFVRGAALRELKQFFNEHDPGHSFAGLKRVISNQGRLIWTSEARVLDMEIEITNWRKRHLSFFDGTIGKRRHVSENQ